MKIKAVKGGLCAVNGVRANGVREGSKGLALIAGKERGGSAVGMFTANKIKAAPVLLTARLLEKGGGRVSAIIANSGCANCFTGAEGKRKAERMAELVASSLGVPEEEVAVASTGPIGKQLDIGLIERQLGEVAEGLTSEARGSTAAAKAIMTTDTFHKEQAVSIETDAGGRVAVGGIAKGSGMIFPHLQLSGGGRGATMLAFIYTDADLSEEVLGRSLEDAVENSFNMVVVDGDMSTNDMVLLVSTGSGEAGEAEKISEAEFRAGLDFVCKELAKQIARDGEGATKFVEVRVRGASSVEDAREVARAVVRSPLVKSAIFGGRRPDLVRGRVAAAVGSCAVAGEFGEEELSVTLKSEGREIFIEVDLGVGAGAGARAGEGKRERKGEGEATAWGCDLSYDYVRINAG